MKKLIISFLAFCLLFNNACAEGLSILCTLPLQALGQGIVNVYKAVSGAEVTLTINTGAIIRERIRKGDKFDIVITTRGDIEEWGASGQLSKDSATGIGKIGYGLGLRKGYPKPDISTVEGLKNALRGAKIIGGSEGSVALGFLEKLQKDLSLTEEMKPKTKVFARGTFPKWLVNGEADMVVSFISEFIHLKESIDYAGPLPKEVQSYVEFFAGIGSTSSKTGEALKFLQFVNGQSVENQFRTTGMERIR